MVRVSHTIEFQLKISSQLNVILLGKMLLKQLKRYYNFVQNFEMIEQWNVHIIVCVVP